MMSSAKPAETAAGKIRTKNGKLKIPPRPPKWDWTVMVYMAGDTNLTEEMVRKGAEKVPGTHLQTCGRPHRSAKQCRAPFLTGESPSTPWSI
jgi:hypothetical protein